MNPNRTPRALHQYNDFAPHVLEGKNNDDAPLDSSGPRRSERQHGYQYSSGQAIRDIPDVEVAPDVLHTLTDYNDTLHYNDTPINYDNYMVHSFGPDPTTWKEALSSKYANEWIEAMLVEKASFDHHKVLEMVPRDAAGGRRLFKPRVVLKIKVNPPDEEHLHGSIEKFKYRLTIAAFTKMLTQGIDYAEKYASTVRWNSIKILVAIAVLHDYDIVLYDIATFFLYGELHDEVYMEQLPEWETEAKAAKDFIYKVNKSMYGLPQAPHCAQKTLKSTLTAGDHFKATTADDCVYVGQHEDEYSVLGCHVDDLAGTGDETGLARIRDTLTKKFKITEKRNPSVITGVQIVRDRKKGWLKLHQGAYVTNLLADYNMTDCNSTDTPMDPGTAKVLMLLPTTHVDPVVLKLYQALVGCLIWLLKTRPDMMFTVNLLARFLKNATQQHLDIARGRPLRYLKGTVDYGLVFLSGASEWKLSGAADSDLAGDLVNSRSTSGHFAKLGEYGAIVCSSKLEKKVSTSTGQAETYAMLSLVKEIVWDRHLLRELLHPQEGPTLVLTDNDGVLKQTTKAINHTAAKHYRIAQAYIREKVDDGVIETGPVASAMNASDIFTKPLHAPAFSIHRGTVMGPQSSDF